jgi:hypothetical protein
MKNLLGIFILFFYSSMLFSQVNFELDFSFEKIDPDDELTNLQLFDYNDDGVEEIAAGFWNENENLMRVIVYSDEGSIIEDFTQSISYYNTPGKSFIFKSNDLENYVLITEHSTDLPNLYLHIYDMGSNVLIDSLNFEEFDLTRFIEINSILKTSIDNIDYFFIGANAGCFVPYDDFHTYIYKFSFVNDNINYVCKMQDCGLEQVKYGEEYIFTSGNHISSTGGAWLSVCSEYYFKKITNEINSSTINLYEYSGSFDYTNPITFYHYPSNFIILSKNNSTTAIHVIHFLSTDTDNGVSTYFVAFNSDSCEIIWNSTLSFIGNGTISSSSTISVNGEEYYIIYFKSSNFEIRDIITGNIIHHQNSPIASFAIKRKSDGELLFFVEQEDETGYDVYVLDGEIQVSVDNYQLPMTSYQLSNYPNPFNPETKISFSIAGSEDNKQRVSISVFNIRGQKVKTLVDKAIIPGRYSVIWNSKDQNGKPVSSSIYFYKLDIDGKTINSKKMLLLK